MLRSLESVPMYPLYRVGTRYFTRLTPARHWSSLVGGRVEKWVPPEERSAKGNCFIPIREEFPLTVR